MKNLYFFQCQDDYNGSIYFPYSCGVLWAYVRQFKDITDRYTLGDIFFEKLEIDEYIKKLVDPHVVLMSNYGWNTAYHNALAEKIKIVFPDTIVIVGGPNVKQDKTYLEKHWYQDISIWGEGEETLLEILRNLDDDWSKVDGVAYYKNGSFVKTATRKRKVDLRAVPSPYLEGIFDNFYQRYSYNFMPVWETNRGCPYHCTFCDVGADYYNKLYEYPLEKLLKEIEWFSKNKIEYMEISDSNFGILERDLEIVKKLKEYNINTGYPKKISTTWAKNSPERVFKMSKILDSMNRGGVTLALQSTNKLALDNIKRFNIVNHKLEQLTKRYIKENIQTYHDFILGLPGETLDSWINGILYVVDINPEGWIFGHPLEAYDNTEFSDSEYIKKHKLKFVTTPQVSFFANRKLNIPIEYGNYVISTFSLTTEEYIECYLFKWFIVTMHNLGWANKTVEQLSVKLNMPRSKIYKKFYDWTKLNPGIIHDNYQTTKVMLEETLLQKRFWGRQIFSTNDIYWEYESATSIEFEKDRVQFYQNLKNFVSNTFTIDNVDTIIEENNNDVLSFEQSQFNNFEEFCREIWWYGRRRKAWKVKNES